MMRLFPTILTCTFTRVSTIHCVFHSIIATMSKIASLEDRLNNQECRNWIKVCHALTILKEGMEEFCTTFKNNLHSNVLDYAQTKGAFVDCTLGCSRKPNYDWCMRCSTWKAIIVKYHKGKSTKINWSASDSSIWMNDPDEIAKLFRPEKSLDGRFGDDLMDYLYLLRSCNLQRLSNDQIIHDVISIRNSIFHCSSLRLSETQLHEYLSKMKDLLRLLYSDISRCRAATNAMSEVNSIAQRTITLSQVEKSDEFVDVRQLLCALLDKRLRQQDEKQTTKEAGIKEKDRYRKMKINRFRKSILWGYLQVIIAVVVLWGCIVHHDSMHCDRLKG